MIKLDIYHVLSWSFCVPNTALLQALLSWVYSHHVPNCSTDTVVNIAFYLLNSFVIIKV